MISGARPASVTRAAQQMAHIGKADFDFAAFVLEKRLPAPIGAGHKLLHDPFGILHGIIRFYHSRAATLGFTVFPFCFLFLNVSGIPQHNAAQVHGGIGGIDGTAIAIFIQVRNLPRMVDVGMGEQQRLIGAGCIGQVGVFVYIPALFHAAIDQQAVARCFQLSAAAGHFTRCAQKGQFHTSTPPWSILPYGLRPTP